MDADRLTTRATEALSAAQTRATVAGAAAIEPVHLLLAILAMNDPTVQSLLSATGAPGDLTVRAERLAAGQPTVTGSTVAPPQPSRALIVVLSVADAEAQQQGDGEARQALKQAAVGGEHASKLALPMRAGKQDYPWTDRRWLKVLAARPHPPAPPLLSKFGSGEGGERPSNQGRQWAGWQDT